MTDREQRIAAKKFALAWKDRGYEKGESQPFWLSLLRDVYGVSSPENFISFEEQVHLDHTSFIDGTIPSTHVLIEQKGLGKDLQKPVRQSDGSLLTPFQQAKRYAAELPYSMRPRWIVACNFREFHIYDMERPGGDPEILLLENLENEYYRLSFLAAPENEHIKKEMEISLQAGEVVGRLYDAILKQYKDPESPEALKSLNVLCVRLVFCLYAEDAGIFGGRAKFHDYLQSAASKDIGLVRGALLDLFRVLDTKPEDRDPYMDETLASFPYVNGGLFTDETILVPRFHEEIVQLLLQKASADFDWSAISPTIFGAVFESTLNPETRRSGGMHYTSVENIHKVIDPLFLDDLKEELRSITEIKTKSARNRALEKFQKKLSSLKFLDPACGSGNFLTETYLSLRRMENQALHLLYDGQIRLGDLGSSSPIQVSIRQFYGIEINDFAVTVARTALWIAESQMMKETEDVVHMNLDFLPLKSYPNITEGNALRLNWEDLISPKELHYIMGNPPFSGARWMGKQQKEDMAYVFGALKNVGNLDYVCAWYWKAAHFMKHTEICAGFVSTNSITQGEQPAILWKPLLSQGISLNFAYRTFCWDNEAAQKARVHCVIIGFTHSSRRQKKYLYFHEHLVREVENINPYLLDAPDIFIEPRKTPLCPVPQIGIGNQPVDGGFYLFDKEEMEQFLKAEPAAQKYFHPWYGAREFLNNCPRYCLYLGNCPPRELRQMPEARKRVEAVRDFRMQSPRKQTRKIAETPTQFLGTNIPDGSYIVIPQVSSEKRRYIPMGYMSQGVLCSDKVRLMPEGTLYHFGVLESNVHMAWMRAICCRLKSDYSYTVNDVYNNFPWCTPTPAQREKIEQTAQAILDARALYPDCSLADLYDELTMPAQLRRAHQANDRAVMQAYGFPVKSTTEASCVAGLMKLYQQLVSAPRP